MSFAEALAYAFWAIVVVAPLTIAVYGLTAHYLQEFRRWRKR